MHVDFASTRDLDTAKVNNQTIRYDLTAPTTIEYQQIPKLFHVTVLIYGKVRKTFIRRTGIIKSLKTEKNLAIIMHYISKTSRLRDVCICVISCFICYAPNCRTSITAHTILTKAIEVSLI